MTVRGAAEVGASRAPATVAIRKAGLVFPREHGAWVMFGAAFFLGAAVAPGPVFHRLGPIATLAVAMFSLFVMREPLSRYWRKNPATASTRGLDGMADGMKKEERDRLLRQAAWWATVAALAGATLVFGYDLWALAGLAVLAAGVMGTYLLLRRRRLERTATAEFLGVAQLALVVPAAYVAAGGKDTAFAFTLWAVTFLYCGAAIPYVKLKVKQAQRRPESLIARLRLGTTSLAYQILALAAVGAGVSVGILPRLALVGFALNALKVVFGVLSVPQGRLNLKGIGWWETALTAIFAVLTAIGYSA